jgi:enolase
VETEITLQGGARGRAMAPAGASTGKDEAIDLRDGGDAFGGFDVQKAIGAVNGEISQLLEGKDATDQAGLDAAMIDLDGTPNKGRLGGNALVATSMAIAHAAAAARDMPLWRYLGEAGRTPDVGLMCRTS